MPATYFLGSSRKIEIAIIINPVIRRKSKGIGVALANPSVSIRTPNRSSPKITEARPAAIPALEIEKGMPAIIRMPSAPEVKMIKKACLFICP